MFKSLKKLDKPVYTSDMYYDFFDGGYITAEKFLDDEKEIEMVNKAKEIILEFYSQLEESGCIENC